MRLTEESMDSQISMANKTPNTFWREAFTAHEEVTSRVVPYVGTIGLFAVAVSLVAACVEKSLGFRFGLEVGFHEIGGVVLTVALMLRTNAGYDRWWESRQLWGGIVNQCRNLAIGGLTYGPKDAEWREALVRWTAAFPYACRWALEGVSAQPQITALVGAKAAAEAAESPHVPSFVAYKLAALLQQAREQGMNAMAFAQIDRERAQLIDHLGGCERILRTPIPQIYSIKIRRILVLFLLTLPFVLVNKVQSEWLVPLVMVIIAYPLIALDQIGHELQNPFSKQNLNHLPLGAISSTIENNVLGLLYAAQNADNSVQVDGRPLEAAIPV